MENIGLDSLNINDIKKLYDSITKNSEFEFIFFSKGEKQLTQEKYIMLLKYLTARSRKNNLRLVPNEITMDVIYNQDKDTSYRCTINGKSAIDNYMKILISANNHVIFRKLLTSSLKESKITVLKKEKSKSNTIDVDDLYFRVRLSNETLLTDDEMKDLSKLDETHINDIVFRFKERTTLYVKDSKNSYVKIDLTVTRTESNYKRLNKSTPRYELEIETITETKDTLPIMFKETENIIKLLQQSNTIITKSESSEIIKLYLKLLSVPKGREKSLYGRQPVSLEVQHVELLANKYAVSDKADGERFFLFIFNKIIYLMNKNLDVKKTSVILKNNDYDNTVLDGELLLLRGVHVFLVFDCLFDAGVDVRKIQELNERLSHADKIIEDCFIFSGQTGYKFIGMEGTKTFDLNKSLEFHTNQIKNMYDAMNSDMLHVPQKMLIRRKYFVHSLGAHPWEIYAYSSMMWNAITNDPNISCPYILDGLVYQPNIQSYDANIKTSLSSDYKWKPPEKNSIDFYIEFMKNDENEDIIVFDNSYNVSEDDTNNDIGNNRILNQYYKICHLHVGKVVNDVVVPSLFLESSNMYIAHLLLKNGEVRDIDGNIVSDKTVVEFGYNTNPGVSPNFKWVPIRTRYEKTEMVLSKQAFGNFITTAERTWKSIINPVLMSDFDELSKGNNSDKNLYFYDKKMTEIRKKISHEDYVDSQKEDKYHQIITNLAAPMKRFHHFIKDTMVGSYVHKMYNDSRQKSVLDLGCGRAVDMMKYYYAQIAFMVGIDYSRDDLFSSNNSAIGRYEQQKKNKVGFPKMYFIHGDFTSELDYDNQFKSLNGMNDENKKMIEKFFSNDPSKRTTFDIINFGFSLHYALKDEYTFDGVKKNIKNYLREDGFVMITTFDAIGVRRLLAGKDAYTQYYTNENGENKILFEIRKKYEDAPEDTIFGVGNTIDVHMAWLSRENVFLTEYLVDHRYLKSELERDCDVELIETELFSNQYEIHKNFLSYYSQFEGDERTKKNLLEHSEFYKKNSVNDGCKIYTSLERTYIFRKRKSGKKNKMTGGDFSDASAFDIRPIIGYDNEYSFINSIHHILKNHEIIPRSLPPNEFCEDMNLEFIQDININHKKIKSISKKIIVMHEIKGKTEKMIDGLNIYLIERDCNDNYDMIELHNKKESNNSIMIMKEGDLYMPIYAKEYENETKYKLNGIFDKNDPLINKLKNIYMES